MQPKIKKKNSFMKKSEKKKILAFLMDLDFVIMLKPIIQSGKLHKRGRNTNKKNTKKLFSIMIKQLR